MRKSFAETMEVGRLLIQAKAAVDHGEWLPLLRSVGLHERTAQMWMRVVRNPRFANASPDLLLPASPTTLSLIARLSDEDYKRLANGFINPAVSGAAIHEQLCKLKQAADEERILGLTPVPGKFRTLVFDPGWPIMSRGTRACTYATMT